MVAGICKLCDRPSELQASHVLPSFLFKWLKRSGHIRHAEAINLRVQDGYKRYWLCRECEQYFGAFEQRFATEIFHPYHSGDLREIRYDDWLLKFCVSISWRCLTHLVDDIGLSHFSPDQQRSAASALVTWKKFLRNQYKHVGLFEQHILTFGLLSELPELDLPPNINRYLARAIQMDAACSSKTSFVFSKLGPFAIFGFIDVRARHYWKGTLVKASGGRFPSDRVIISKQLWKYIGDRAHRLMVANSKISDAQRDQINKEIMKDPDKFVTSEFFKAIERDIDMFGQAAFSKRQPSPDEA